MLTALVCPANADLVLDLPEHSVVPGQRGSMEVNVRSTTPQQSLTAWQFEFMADAHVEWLEFLGASRVLPSPLAPATAYLKASAMAGKLQVQGAVASLDTPATVSDQAGWVPLFRIDYVVSPDAQAGESIVINFGANVFTNIVDAQFQPISLQRSGGALNVSAVPEASAVWTCSMLTLIGISSSWVRRFSRDASLAALPPGCAPGRVGG